GRQRNRPERQRDRFPGGHMGRREAFLGRYNSSLPPIERASELFLQREAWPYQPRVVDLFRVTAARTRVFNASSSIVSPSWKSIARRVLPSRLELKRRAGSFSAAPLAKVIFTTFL